MTNVISFMAKEPVHTKQERYAALVSCFANGRRVTEDVFWLKENAELLGILQSTAADVPLAALDPYRCFYSSAMERLAFFPQYYRFLLGITLDLEDLGMTGDTGAQMCAYVAERQLYDAELSDLQRGEAMRLLARRGYPIHDADGLTDRLYRFIRRSETFAVPNRKAAYELTHILFYLSDYGRLPMRADDKVERSLIYTGLLALLEDNLDLLSEVCVALHYGGLTVPKAWQDVIRSAARQTNLQPRSDGRGDEYHCYLMMNWSLATGGQEAFDAPVDRVGTAFHTNVEPLGALRALSYMLYNHTECRVNDWDGMKHKASQHLSAPIIAHIDFVQSTTPQFDTFFADFVRAAPGGSTALRGV